MWHDSVDCEGADVDSETQRNTDELYPHITLLDKFLEEKTKSLSSKNKFKATLYLNHNDNCAKTHHKGTYYNHFFLMNNVTIKTNKQKKATKIYS